MLMKTNIANRVSCFAKVLIVGIISLTGTLNPAYSQTEKAAQRTATTHSRKVLGSGTIPRPFGGNSSEPDQGRSPHYAVAPKLRYQGIVDGSQRKSRTAQQIWFRAPAGPKRDLRKENQRPQDGRHSGPPAFPDQC